VNLYLQTITYIFIITFEIFKYSKLQKYVCKQDQPYHYISVFVIVFASMVFPSEIKDIRFITLVS